MKTVFVSQLEASKPANGIFLVQHKEIRYKKGKGGPDSGEPFLSLTLSDRTGDVDAKMWDNVAGVMMSFEQDDFVEVKGILQYHNNRKQLTIHRLQRVEESQVDLADFLPCSARDPQELLAELKQFIAGVGNPHLRALLELVFSDPEIVPGVLRAPAGKSVHHACIGGLLEHVVSLCHLCRFAAKHYPGLDPDLLLAGAMLHDIGKIRELSYERSFGYTDEGQLLGHIPIGLLLVTERIARVPEFPPRLRTLLQHLILSHHGELEYGSPKVPVFPEAVLLHYLEDLDAKMDCMRRTVERDNHVEGNWTGYCAPMDRVLLKKTEYLNSAPPQPAAEAAPAGINDLAARWNARLRDGGK